MKKILLAGSLFGMVAAGVGCERKVNPYTDEGYAPSRDLQERRQHAPAQPQENP